MSAATAIGNGLRRELVNGKRTKLYRDRMREQGAKHELGRISSWEKVWDKMSDEVELIEVSNNDKKYMQVGGAMLQWLVETALVPGTKDVQAFKHYYATTDDKRGDVKKYGHISLHNSIAVSMEDLNRSIAQGHVKVLPMLVEPLPWLSPGSRSGPSGGYLTVRSNMMRTKQGGLREQSRALKEADLRRLYQVVAPIAMPYIAGSTWC